MKKHKKKRKGFNAGSIRCPYCKGPVSFRSADGIYRDNRNKVMLYVCNRYPKCDAYVRTHAGTNIPVGTLANHELRTLRREAHFYFDQLHQTGRRLLDRYKVQNNKRVRMGREGKAS